MNNVSEIVRSEFRLVSLEVKQEAAELKTAAISLAIGNVLLLYGGLFLLLGVVYALTTVWPAWLAALVVGAGVAITGAVLTKLGIARLKRPKSGKREHL
jgi:ABC-type cobalamin transport system permease subunit